jgi:hypothetical protein
MFPRFRVAQNEFSEIGVALGLVTATTYGNETWVGDGWIAYLMADMKLIRGRWHLRGDLWAFAPEDAGAVQALFADSEWAILDGYWGGRAELVLDLGRQWQRTRFEPRDAVRSMRHDVIYMKARSSEPAQGELVEGGWDHEHCEICWVTLGAGGTPDGYVSKGTTWVCERCYDAFVQRRSLEFIPIAESP